VGKQFTLGKHERLKSRKSIEQLFSEGKKLNVAPYRVLYTAIQPSENPSLLFGTGVSAKSFKKAVDRNRIKRLTREAWRLQKNPLLEKIKAKNIQLNVFFIYTGKELLLYDEVFKKVGSVLKKMDKLTGE
jgi:ribonuclease P protein component